MSVEMDTITCGDCLDWMKTLPENSLDACVTDPPYELGFMGKSWDGSGIAYSVPMWKEVLRVLKPGGHLLSFGGTRTYHRMACAIEDAGFEIRDQIQWLYGSGFPKSLDVSKAIDRMDASKEQERRQLRFTAWMRETCRIGAARANEVMGTDAEAGHYFTAGEQPHIATREHFEKLRPYFVQPVPDWVEAMVDQRTVESRNMAAREVIGKASQNMSADSTWVQHGGSGRFRQGYKEWYNTVPATPAAKEWDGWGTALKPANEPVCVARKPLSEKTVAANVLKWGTGGINVDGCRIDVDLEKDAAQLRTMQRSQKHEKNGWGMNQRQADNPQVVNPQGRWPANVILDEEAGRMLDEMSGVSKATVDKKSYLGRDGTSTFAGKQVDRIQRGDTGGASRYFKCISQDAECGLCGLTLTCEHGIMNGKKGDLPCSGTLAQSAESVLKTIRAIIGSIVRESADMKPVEQLALNVLSVESLCASCAIVIAQSIVLMRRGQDPAQHLGWDSICERKGPILLQCLASFAALLGNTDTIPTTDALSLFFGCVRDATRNNTQTGGTEIGYDQASRLCYCAKASRAERDMSRKDGNPGGDNPRNRGVHKRGNHHPTVKPIALMCYLCRLVTPPTGVILEPFAGSGTTCIAAIQECFHFLACEKEAEYVEIAKARIEAARNELPLFAPIPETRKCEEVT